MTVNYINGIQVGSEASSSGMYAWGTLHARRLIYLWLSKVVGWPVVDSQGSNWDNPVVSQQTDGSTSSSTDLISATDFSAAGVVPGDLVLITAGFSDPTRHGVYQISSVHEANKIRIDSRFGVHHSGLPTGQTNVTFEIHRLATEALLPAINDFFVLGGSGVGGTFHTRCLIDNSVNYAPERWDISPWDDWDSIGHAWKTPPNRYTAITQNAHQQLCDRCWVWGWSDGTAALIIFSSIKDSGGLDSAAEARTAIYLGDAVPNWPIEDTRPVVLWSDVDRYYFGVKRYSGNTVISMVGADDTTQISALHWYLTQSVDGTTNAFPTSGTRRVSAFTGKHPSIPIFFAHHTSQLNEVRGALKGLKLTGLSSESVALPTGSSREYLRFSDLIIPWNGSKVYRVLPR